MRLFEMVYWNKRRGIFVGGGRRRIRPAAVIQLLIIAAVAIFSIWAASQYDQTILRAIGKLG